MSELLKALQELSKQQNKQDMLNLPPEQWATNMVQGLGIAAAMIVNRTKKPQEAVDHIRSKFIEVLRENQNISRVRLEDLFAEFVAQASPLIALAIMDTLPPDPLTKKEVEGDHFAG